MTPCKKLGYKVGDRFEVIEHHSFKKGDVVTLREDDGSKCPAFTGENGSMVTNGVTWSFARLSDLRPVRSSKLTKSKQFLADAIYASGKGWPDGAKFSAQNKRSKAICFYENGQPQRPQPGEAAWSSPVGTGFMCGIHLMADRVHPNWHQTILSCEEYFSAYPAEVVQPLPETFNCRCAMVEVPKPTIEQLAADYRNKLDFANRKQLEAEDAKTVADAALGELESAGEVLGLVIGVAKPESEPRVEPELVITDWRDLRVGDIIQCVGSWERENTDGLQLTVTALERDTYEGDLPIRVEVPGISCPGTWGREFKFIRRP